MKRLNALFGKWTGVVLTLILIWTFIFIWKFFEQPEIDLNEGIAFAGVLSLLALVMGFFPKE